MQQNVATDKNERKGCGITDTLTMKNWKNVMDEISPDISAKNTSDSLADDNMKVQTDIEKMYQLIGNI